MKTYVIVNPNAGSAEQFETLKRRLEAMEGTTFFESDGPGKCVNLARQALDAGADRILTVGGDGTISEVVNGILGHEGEARLGILPFGTGNDLSRMLGIPDEPRDALAMLNVGEVRRLDAFVVESANHKVYGINAAAGGFSGQVGEVLTSELKAAWGPLAYIIGAASALPDLQEYVTHLAFDDEPPEVVNVFNVIVANGRTIGGGKRVAPEANPEDGLLDVLTIRYGPVLELGKVAAQVMAGNYVNSPLVTHRRARKVRVTSEPGMWFNVDGELITNEPLTITILPQALPVIVGTDYKAAVSVP